MKRFAVVMAAVLGFGCSGSLGCGGSKAAGPAGSGGSGEAEVGVSKKAPEFTAADQTGKVRTLGEFRGKYVVLYFYPKDDTPGCTTEACAFRDRWKDLEAAGAQVIGVSTDSVESHAAFAKEHELPFPLLADVDGKVTDAYNVPVTMGFARRMTFIIDKGGVIRRVWPDVDPGVHAEEVIQTLKSLGDVEAK